MKTINLQIKLSKITCIFSRSSIMSNISICLLQNKRKFLYSLALLFFLLTVKCSAQILIDEGFEGTFPPPGWTILNLGGQTTGETWIQTNSFSHSGSYSAFSQDGEAGYAMEEWLVTPSIAVPANQYLTMSFWQQFQWANYGDGPEYVLISTTNSTPSAFTDTILVIPQAGEPVNWTQVNLNYIGGYAGQNIYIAFHHTSPGGYADAWVLDDILIESIPLAASDIGILSTINPGQLTFINSSVYPSCIIKNFGTVAISSDFQIMCIISDSISQTVYSSIFNHTGTISASVTETISFPDVWQPSESGNYYVSFLTNLAGDANSVNDTLLTATEVYQHYGTGGPDAFGYSWIDSYESGGPLFNWIEISSTGASAITYNTAGNFSGDNNFSEPIPFGFDFPFYGISRQYFYVDINGSILLSDNSWYVNYPNNPWYDDGNPINYLSTIPGYTQMPALVAVLWDDLTADSGTGDIYFQTFGTAPNRFCVIEWNNLRYSWVSVADTTLTFEAIFYENGEIIFQYKDVNIGQTSGAVLHDNGNSSTIGIQNDEANIGLCYLKESYINTNYSMQPIGNLLTDSLALRFYTGEDVYPPVFSYNGKGNTLETTPVIKIKINDLSGINYDTLYYNTGFGWVGITHTGFAYPDTFFYQLPYTTQGVVVNYYFSATDNSVNQNNGRYPSGAPTTYFSFKVLPSDGANVLLARSAVTDTYGIESDAFTNALDNAGVIYDIYNWDEYLSYNIPSQYKAVFVYANMASATSRYDSLSRALMDYLDLGTITDPKNIFMASDNFGYAGYGYANDKPMLKFFKAYLRCGYIPQENPPYYGGTDGVGGPGIYDYSSGSIIGVANSPIGYNGIEIPVYSNTPDVIDGGIVPSWYENEVTNPGISSELAFKFEDGPNAGQAYSYHNPCGIWLDNLIYKSFFLSFDLSQLENVSDAQSIINNAVICFDVPTSSTFSESTKKSYISCYPNPADESIFVMLRDIADNNEHFLELFGISGELLMRQNVTGNLSQIDLTTLTPGIYFLKYGGLVKKIVKL